MKMSVEWHEGCLKNQRETREMDLAALERMCNRIERENRNIEFYERQIAEAKKQGKDSFDMEKFLVKRPKTDGRVEYTGKKAYKR